MVTITLTSEDLLSIAEAARALGRARLTIYRWMKAGKIAYVKLGGNNFIPKAEIERLRG